MRGRGQPQVCSSLVVARIQAGPPWTCVDFRRLQAANTKADEDAAPQMRERSSGYVTEIEDARTWSAAGLQQPGGGADPGRSSMDLRGFPASPGCEHQG